MWKRCKATDWWTLFRHEMAKPFKTHEEGSQSRLRRVFTHVSVVGDIALSVSSSQSIKANETFLEA